MSELNYLPATETDLDGGSISGTSADELNLGAVELSDDEPRQNLGEAFKEALPYILHTSNAIALINTLIGIVTMPPVIEALPFLLMAIVLSGAAFFKTESKSYLSALVFILTSAVIALW